MDEGAVDLAWFMCSAAPLVAEEGPQRQLALVRRSDVPRLVNHEFLVSALPQQLAVTHRMREL